jgi:hypothetical protein
MMLIKGEYFYIGTTLYDHVKIQGDILAGRLAELYEENDCDSVEEFLDCIKDESILIYIKKEGV